MLGGMRNVNKILVRKSEGKRPLERHRHRWEDIIKMVLKEVLYEGAEWIYLAKHKDSLWAFLNVVMNFSF
jgi:hypothetical protein